MSLRGLWILAVDRPPARMASGSGTRRDGAVGAAGASHLRGASGVR